MDDSLDVHVHGITTYKGKRRTTYTVKWSVAARRWQRTFDTVKLADSFRAELLASTRRGTPFEVASGLPADQRTRDNPSWLDHAMAFVDMKWPHASPRHRKGIAEGLTTATLAMLPASAHASSTRSALRDWAFNASARARPSPTQIPSAAAESLASFRRQLPRIGDLAKPTVLRPVLDALSRNIDGSSAAPSTIARKRSAVYSALDYAVELGHLQGNPMDRIKWSAPSDTAVVDSRVVINPGQAATLLAAVRAERPSLEAFFACIYFAALRPAEVRHLRVQHLDLPSEPGAWGSLLLAGSTQASGRRWTDSGQGNEDRQLKHRGRRATRRAPAPPLLVDTLRRHLATFPTGADGRLFVARTGPAGVPLAGPYGSPQAMGTVYRVWDGARRAAFSQAEYDSQLAKRPYDLRHAAVSLWLNAGVPPTQVAEWAGHSVNVLLRVYAACVVGQDEVARLRVGQALGTSGTSSPVPPGQPHTADLSHPQPDTPDPHDEGP